MASIRDDLRIEETSELTWSFDDFKKAPLYGDYVQVTGREGDRYGTLSINGVHHLIVERDGYCDILKLAIVDPRNK